MRTFNDAKAMAKVLREAFAAHAVEVTHSETLEIVAHQFGCADWNVLAARIEASDGITIEPAVPILRIFDVAKAMEFYRDFLGFTVAWEHRFADGLPLYCEVTRSGVTLHLSEHAGDASPAARVFIPMSGVRALHAELTAKEYSYMRPGIETVDWGFQLEVIDPFSNRLTFCERT